MNIELNESNTQLYTSEYFLELLETSNDTLIITNIAVNTDVLTNVLKSISTAEIAFLKKTNTLKYLEFDIKSATTEIKQHMFNTWLTLYDNINPYVILNLISLLRAYNDFSDDFFSSKQIYFNDITEFLDIKLECKENIDAFINEFACWYFSLFRSAHKLEFNFLDTVKKLPLCFEKIFFSTDYITISGIISKCNIQQINELHLVENALFYITALSQKMSIASNLQNIFNKT